MDEKQLLEMSGIEAQDWERTPVSVRQLVVQLGLKLEATRATPQRITGI
jgi:transposase